MKSKFVLIFTFLLLLQSCFYKKVLVTKQEKNSIVYHNNQQYLYKSNTGTIDTVEIHKGYPNGHEPNFDFWWRRKISKSDTVSTQRYYGKQYLTYPNFEKNKFKTESINLSTSILYSKSEFDNRFTLSIYPFEEKYWLSGENKQYIFEKNDSKKLNTCADNPYCINKLIYEEGRGIVLVEKGNGATWKLLRKIK